MAILGVVVPAAGLNCVEIVWVTGTRTSFFHMRYGAVRADCVYSFLPREKR